MGTQINLISQGKGGVGKSLVAALLSQYHLSRNRNVTPIDTDPVNATLNNFAALSPVFIEIMGDNDLVDERKFDQLIENIIEISTIEHDDEQNIVVIDSGASSFVPLAAYLKENKVIPFLKENGIETLTHAVITGGQAMLDTMKQFKALAEGDAFVYVWKNEYFGPIVSNGVSFEDSAIYNDHQGKVKGIIEIKRKNQNTFGKDMEEMLRQHLTFDEAINSDTFSLMSRQRLKIVKNEIYESIENAGI